MILTEKVSRPLILKRHILMALLLLLSFYSLSAYSITVLNFGVNTLSGEKKQAYETVIKAFEAENPNIKIRLKTLSGKGFSKINKSLLQRLESEPYHLDLLTWYGGKRTEELAKKGLLYPLDDFWQKQNYDHSFGYANKENVSFSDHVYGIPMSYYPWGFFYNKKLFAKLNMNPPDTWGDFLDVLSTLKANNVTPIAIGTKEPWPAAGWFDYFILRNNSFSFYQQLMMGKVAYNSPQVIQALTLWQQLINNKYFSRNPQRLDGENLLPLISREVAGVQLIGSFALITVSDRYKKDFGYFAFPSINEENGVYNERNEIAPLSTISLLKSSKYKEQALHFLSYLSLPEVQSKLNEKKATLSPHNSAQNYSENLIGQGKAQLENATHLSQYFDRETDQAMAKFAKQAFADFIEHGDIERLVGQLEKQRKKVFPQQ
jgi:multiple sugar transport system substrate-binding protein